MQFVLVRGEQVTHGQSVSPIITKHHFSEGTDQSNHEQEQKKKEKGRCETLLHGTFYCSRGGREQTFGRAVGAEVGAEVGAKVGAKPLYL